MPRAPPVMMAFRPLRSIVFIAVALISAPRCFCRDNESTRSGRKGFNLLRGCLVTACFNGVETLRVTTARGAYNANFYMLVPAPTAQPTLTIGRSGGGIVIPGIESGFVLESTTQLGGSWAPVQNQTNPFF